MGRLHPSQDHKQRTTKKLVVCKHWLAGNCNRFPCQFLHSRELVEPSWPKQQQQQYAKRFSDDHNPKKKKNYNNNTWRRSSTTTTTAAGGGGVVVTNNNKTEKVVCKYWVKEKCNYGNSCKYLHSWTTGNCFTLLAQLQGHEKVVTGIALPSGSDKLYSGSTDKTVRLWDCQYGTDAGVFNLDGEIGCMLTEGPWIFVGLPNFVKARHTQTGTVLSLNGPIGQVYALVFDDNNHMLFAGTEEGPILAWRFVNGSNFERAATLIGHTHHVVSLFAGAGNILYSGSMDKSIRVWSLETFQCLQVLTDHTSTVMSVLCWEDFLLSCSLDKTIKVWAANESGNLEVTYTHQEDSGVLTLCGVHDSEAKPVLLCSCSDNTVRVYDLPSFSERGRIFSKQAVRRIEIGPGGLLFTGGESGQVRVWKWLTDHQSSSTTTA
ncbi:zinc finger CCCH domain-containing protein 48-like [Nicotiana tabacum]|uniref:Zinc finger CCCH domain-containing protein 48-like n=3 Tax=Nicotiana TaxID=4085 RepID=A0A1S4CH26_TOBAC|nr:PREDICTED: zinc finger CCCH domain-containing protein 48-like [Nicotiana sylvestris]XP_016500438.1 PREDICTED: zinc finger CCCH domain-containing protein 48-like [Nicotiana tabacum]